MEGYENIDSRPEVLPDVVLDVCDGLPYSDNSVDEVRAFDFLEHIPIGKTVEVIEGIWRILKPGGIFESLTPSTDGRGAFQDPTHVSFWNENSWLYYSHPAYRRLYGTKANFKIEHCQNVTSDGRIVHTHVIAEKRTNDIKIAVISANLGGIDPDYSSEHVKQRLPENVKLDFFNFTNETYPVRGKVMSPRLQAKIPRMMGWKLKPGYDYYVWLDSAITLKHETSIMWLLNQCADIALFKHPFLDCIRDEVGFIIQEMSTNNGYLIDRYQYEPLAEQLETYSKDPDFVDDKNFAAGVFMYRNTPETQKFMTTWLMHCVLYSINDQVSFPYVMLKHKCEVNGIEGDIYDNNFFEYHHRELKDAE